MLSKDDATSFLENTIHFKNWHEILKQDKLEFLRLLNCCYSHHTYFQFITVAALPPEERSVPNEASLIKIGLEGRGGTCIIRNGFMVKLLQTLGFKSYLVASTYQGAFSHLLDNHVICIVEFNEVEKYLLDFGGNLPLDKPVPLHKLPYEEVSTGFRFRYRKEEELSDVYVRTQMDGSAFSGPWNEKNDFEYIRLKFILKPKTLEYFKTSIGIMYTDPIQSIFLQMPMLFRYYEEDDDGNVIDEVNCGDNRKYIQINGVSVLKGSKNKRKVTHYKNYDELLPIIKKYFGKLHQKEVDNAWAVFNAHATQHGYFRHK